MYGIIDCDNCYVSCERVFRPDLKDKPVVVLSNNDGCVVARSNEAKKMGIKAGTPYFQLAEQFPNQKIVVFSSNYELYGELTSRVVSIILLRFAAGWCIMVTNSTLARKRGKPCAKPSSFSISGRPFSRAIFTISRRGSAISTTASCRRDARTKNSKRSSIGSFGLCS